MDLRIFHASLMSVFKFYRNANVFVYSNSLQPAEFRDLPVAVTLVRYSFPALVPRGTPGRHWVDLLLSGRLRGAPEPFRVVHTADFMRLLLVFMHGGTYLDVDAVLQAPLPALPAIITRSNDDYALPCPLGTVMDDCVPRQCTKVGDDPLLSNERFYLSNGLLLNFPPHSPFMARALAYFGRRPGSADMLYSPKCWGCEGPGLMTRTYVSFLHETGRPPPVNVLPWRTVFDSWPDECLEDAGAFLDRYRSMGAAPPLLHAHIAQSVKEDSSVAVLHRQLLAEVCPLPARGELVLPWRGAVVDSSLLECSG